MSFEKKTREAVIRSSASKGFVYWLCFSLVCILAAVVVCVVVANIAILISSKNPYEDNEDKKKNDIKSFEVVQREDVPYWPSYAELLKPLGVKLTSRDHAHTLGWINEYSSWQGLCWRFDGSYGVVFTYDIPEDIVKEHSVLNLQPVASTHVTAPSGSILRIDVRVDGSVDDTLIAYEVPDLTNKVKVARGIRSAVLINLDPVRKYQLDVYVYSGKDLVEPTK